jgi:Type II secretion system (T2SS), protein E, N-terminal domain
MRFTTKYATVGQGVHADDERMYRTEGAQPCASCGAMTEWTDVVLEVPVCSEECHHRVSTRSTAKPLLGQFLIKEKLITEAQLDEALRLQASMDPYTPIGQVLVGQKFITLKQLNSVLDKYRKRPKLGAVLIAAKVITEVQLEQAMANQRARRARLGDTLIQLGLATETQIKQAVCIQLNLPFIDLDDFALSKSGLAGLIKRSYAEKNRVVPIARLGNTLTVAMDDPTDREVIRMVEASTGLVVNVAMATRAGLQRAIPQVYD